MHVMSITVNQNSITSNTHGMKRNWGKHLKRRFIDLKFPRVFSHFMKSRAAVHEIASNPAVFLLQVKYTHRSIHFACWRNVAKHPRFLEFQIPVHETQLLTLTLFFGTSCSPLWPQLSYRLWLLLYELNIFLQPRWLPILPSSCPRTILAEVVVIYSFWSTQPSRSLFLFPFWLFMWTTSMRRGITLVWSIDSSIKTTKRWSRS